MDKQLNRNMLETALESLGIRLRQNAAGPYELVAAGQWAKTHDPSEGFAMILKTMLEQLGYHDAAKRV